MPGDRSCYLSFVCFSRLLLGPLSLLNDSSGDFIWQPPQLLTPAFFQAGRGTGGEGSIAEPARESVESAENAQSSKEFKPGVECGSSVSAGRASAARIWRDSGSSHPCCPRHSTSKDPTSNSRAPVYGSLRKTRG